MTSSTELIREIADDLVSREIPCAWGGGGMHGPSRGLSDGGGQADTNRDFLKEGFDAGSLAQYVLYQVFGIEIPRTTFTQRSHGYEVPEPDPGDLVFPYDHNGYATVYLGGKSVLAAPRSGTLVQIQPLPPSPNNIYIRMPR
ncbi:cell wall-associated hydrolase, invasion-associated protein [Mycobacteroides abscessus subsp. abscessus]|jgi:cell wall-associated NlpC family hydrolase|uniref:C40 family peptidase n=1 Tax=Mycobacteroides abscessus TaxID=36809 RepID=UPI00092A22E2|nr:NlpC/P60 family protein [Mycobacteroides abscessus]SIH22503.1 cell wall-associated hydrolase, invasion-associated protein [Mycobacteroides abscessus subsp. abscessus]